MTALSEGGRFREWSARVMAAHVPLHALFEITERCNYACSHCYLPHRGDDELTTEEAKRALDQLAQAGSLFLTLSGGEVFLRRDFLEIARHALEKEFVLRIFTNGWFVDEERAAALAALSPLAVEISLYGPDAVTFEAVTKVPGSFARTTAAISRLSSRGVPVVAKSPVMSVNARRLPQTETLAHSLGASFKWDALLSPMDGGEETPLALRPSSAELAFVYAWERERRGGGELEPGPLSAAPCNAGRGSVAISPRGDVYACVAIKVPAGNLRERPFREIWEGGSVLRELRGLTVAGLRECATCEDRAYCPRCAGVARHETGRLDGPSEEACRIAAVRRAVFEGREIPRPVRRALPVIA